MPLDAFMNTFAGNPLDRASDKRRDEAWIAEKLAAPDSLGVALWNGRVFVEDAKSAGGAQIAYISAAMAGELAQGDERLLFLGLWKDTAVFAVDLDGPADPADGPLQGLGRFDDLRATALMLPPTEAAILATAKQMFEWRRRHMHCAACGQPSQVAEAGWKRVCPSCKAEHFPRTDPVVIMLAVSGERCLLGRQSRFAPGMWSCLAGFVEPGESIEEAARRETLEEAGIECGRVRYFASQPWPFPSSLMIGCHAEAISHDITVDREELEDARWFSRDEAAAMLMRRHPQGLGTPPPVAIAHHIIRAWVEKGHDVFA